MHERCDHLLAIALHVRGTNAVDGTEQRLREALEVASCCRQKGRCDLALELLDQVESFELGRQEPFASASREQRERIANGDVGAVEVPPIELPPLHERIKNFAIASAKHAANGFQMCEPEMVEMRVAICRGCEFLVNDHCGKCGCPCVPDAYLSKVAWKSERCPLNPPKW